MERVPYAETSNPEAVETLFCKKLDESGVREPLNESTMSVLLALVLSDSAKIEEMLSSAKKITATISILEDRSKSIGLELDDKTLIFFGLISGTPGVAVMYSYYLAYAFKKLGKETMKFDDIMVEVFPAGMFTDESLNEHWDLQKVDNSGQSTSDNLVDYSIASESITRS
jgi:hypothetical protein